MSHPLYVVWYNMKQRCTNANRKDHEYYGAKGISYDQRWEKFAGFYEDMREGWQPGLELDRKENAKNYSKDNCRWVTVKESRQNRGIFKNNTSKITGVGTYQGGFRARVGKNGATVLYQGPDFFEACCARKSWEDKWLKRGAQ